MTDLHIHANRLTPQMRSVLERMARAGHAPLYTRTPQDARTAYAAGADVLEIPKAALPRVEDFTIPARDGHALPARLYAPTLRDAGVQRRVARARHAFEHAAHLGGQAGGMEVQVGQRGGFLKQDEGIT